MKMNSVDSAELQESRSIYDWKGRGPGFNILLLDSFCFLVIL